MARYRKPSVISLVSLAAIVMVFYSHQLVDSDPQHNQPLFIISGPERADQNQTSNQKIPLDDGVQEVQSTIEEQLITEDSRYIPSTAIENITFGHPSGTLKVGAETAQENDKQIVNKVVMSRSARVLMEGSVHIPTDAF